MSIDKTFEDSDQISRRQFVTASITALGATSLVTLPNEVRGENVQDNMTVQDVIDIIIKNIPNAPYQKTVDTIKVGNGNQIVTGIITTMFATIPVIQKAIELKANFIIAHEPTFYNHADETEWLAQDKVYQFKKDLLEKNNIAVWRCHDYLHSHQLDGVQLGVLNALGWRKYYNAESPRMVILPPTSLKDIIHLCKNKLGIKTLRLIGDLNQQCVKIAVLPGAPGGKGQIQTLQNEQPDLLICGELQEWETSEYVRDARAMGKKLSLVVLGHAVSEEPGLEWLKEWLQPKLGNLKITHVPSLNPFTWI
jgi:putative NIF3 family GTP cyclohydrolase 1 type 2